MSQAKGGIKSHSLRQHVGAWERELANTGDPDESFILDGIREGFRLTTEGSEFHPVEVDNYNSTTAPEVAHLVHDQIRLEVENGRYVVTREKPTIVSALGAIPKDKNKIRLIHDCSRPEGNSLNSYAETDTVRFQSVREAVQKIYPNYYLAKIDLEAAYRSVAIHPDDFASTGLKWRFPGEKVHSYMYDTRLPFGAKRAPGIFHPITQAVRRMMARKGYPDTVVYLDDWLVIAPSKEACLETMNVLLKLLRELGFSISYKKVVMPAVKLTFLGIEIDSQAMLLTLPEDKAQELQDLVVHFSGKRHASLRQLQTLAGKLNWAAQVVCGGRPFLQRILDMMGLLRQARHKAKLEASFYEDLAWWFR